MSVSTRFFRLFAALAIAIVLLSSKAWGWDCGRWHLPSTNAQYFGYGYGPGHHAPMLRMPCCQPLRVKRIAFTPQCPQNHCSSCATCVTPQMGPTLHRELESPAEMVPTPAPPQTMHPVQSRHVPHNAFLR